MSDFGINFLPSDSATDQGSPTALSPAQSAIKILSLSLPKFQGAAPVDRSLMANGPRTSGVSPESLVMQALQNAMGNKVGGQSAAIDEILKSFGIDTTGSAPPPRAQTPGFTLGDDKTTAEPTPTPPVPTGRPPVIGGLQGLNRLA